MSPLTRRGFGLVALALFALLLIPVTAQAQTTVWSDTLNPFNLGGDQGVVGCIGICSFALTDNQFSYGDPTVTYTIVDIYVATAGNTAGNLYLNLDTDYTQSMKDSLILDVDGTQLALADTTFRTDIQSYAYWTNTGLTWASGTNVALKLVTNASANSEPVITTTSPQTVAENETAVVTLTATDADSDDTLTWSKNGGDTRNAARIILYP